MSEGLKRLLYERFLHFAHVSEQAFSSEIDAFIDLAHYHGIDAIPSNLTSVHVIDCIGQYEPINNTSIADKMNLSKASITKISAKLLSEGFIRRSQMNDNKKEVYFSLSARGKAIYDMHAKMHVMMEQRFVEAMSSFSESELQATLKFFQTMIEQTDAIVKGAEKE